MSFGRNLSNKYRKQLLDAAVKTGIDTLKTASKKVDHEAVEATGEFIGNKIVNNIVKSKPVPGENSRNVQEIIISPKQRREILNELRQVL